MAVCYLPELPEPVKRKLGLLWDELLAKYGFTGGHLKWHQTERQRRADRMTQTWRNEHFSKDYPEFVDPIGITETVTLAKERFGQLAEQYLILWAAAEDPRCSKLASWLQGILGHVEDEACAPWLAGGTWYSDWFTRACRPELHRALGILVSQVVARARALEIQHLETPDVGVLHLLHADGDVRLARLLQEGEQAVTRSRHAVDRLTDASEEARPDAPGAIVSDAPGEGVTQTNWASPARTRPQVSPSVLRRHHKDREIEEVRVLARQWLTEGATHQQICQRLKDKPRPCHAAWRHLPWDKAFNEDRYRNSVRKWLSKNCRP